MMTYPTFSSLSLNPLRIYIRPSILPSYWNLLISLDQDLCSLLLLLLLIICFPYFHFRHLHFSFSFSPSFSLSFSIFARIWLNGGLKRLKRT